MEYVLLCCVKIIIIDSYQAVRVEKWLETMRTVDSWKEFPKNVCKPSPLPAVLISIIRRNEVSTEPQGNTLQSNARHGNISFKGGNSRVSTEPIQSLDVENVDKPVEMLEYC